ncbi:unnamed protein product [Blepharisma stoltei]|uniref:Uncharacterized protein n=1 Tax=Blepharisma stoltei TaxID=1481888 RepID=A0AAU9IDG0_9CILI|nr:unnamed protein product [Blepharisma stoltei]
MSFSIADKEHFLKPSSAIRSTDLWFLIKMTGEMKDCGTKTEHLCCTSLCRKINWQRDRSSEVRWKQAHSSSDFMDEMQLIVRKSLLKSS